MSILDKLDRRGADFNERMLLLMVRFALIADVMFLLQTALTTESTLSPTRHASTAIVFEFFLQLGLLVLYWVRPPETIRWPIRILLVALGVRWALFWWMLDAPNLWVIIVSTMLYMPPLLLLAVFARLSKVELAVYLALMTLASVAGVTREEIAPFNDPRLPPALVIGWGILAIYFAFWRVEHAKLGQAETVQQSLTAQANRDPLTGLPNRRACQQSLDDLLESNKKAAIVIFDLDHFKQINDKYGHDTGDLALKTFADVLAGFAQDGIKLGRWGGEEFVAVLLDIDATAANQWAEKVRQTCEATRRDGLRLTVSAGIAICQDGDTSMAFRRADAALYKAKLSGRNQVCLEQG